MKGIFLSFSCTGLTDCWPQAGSITCTQQADFRILSLPFMQLFHTVQIGATNVTLFRRVSPGLLCPVAFLHNNLLEASDSLILSKQALWYPILKAKRQDAFNQKTQ